MCGVNEMSEAVLCLTEQIKPQHIVGEDSLDNDDEPRKGELHEELRQLCSACYAATVMCDCKRCQNTA